MVPCLGAFCLFTFIAASVLIALLSGFGKDIAIVKWLIFGPVQAPFAAIEFGQVWRLITPIFLHFGIMHLLFDVIMFYQFGTLVETAHGSLRALLLILVGAVISNVAEAVFGHRIFGGMSGVVYAQFGYVWMRGRFDPSVGFSLRSDTVFILVAWATLCSLNVIPNAANAINLGGLFTGMIIGLTTALIRRQGWV